MAAKGLTREMLTAAALRIVDGDGLEALSMRRLGSELRVDPMAAYRHIPNKGILLDEVVEAVMSEIDIDAVDARSRGRTSCAHSRSPTWPRCWPIPTRRP